MVLIVFIVLIVLIVFKVFAIPKNFENYENYEDFKNYENQGSAFIVLIVFIVLIELKLLGMPSGGHATTIQSHSTGRFLLHIYILCIIYIWVMLYPLLHFLCVQLAVSESCRCSFLSMVITLVVGDNQYTTSPLNQ